MEKRDFALTNARILTITQGIIEKGSLLVEQGKISALGEKIEIPEGTKTYDLDGAWVLPGLIDAHTHISNFGEPNMMKAVAMFDGNEMSKPITPEVRALDALNPFDPAIKKARNGGITTACTLPGSGNLIGGTGVVYKLRGHSPEEMIYPGKEHMKFALGENPKTNYHPRNVLMTRMGNAAQMRKALFDATVYAEKKADSEKKGEYFAKDFVHEALLPVIEGKMLCRIHSHRADDILTAIRISEEFKLNYAIEHCTEGYKIKDILAEKGVRAVVGPISMSPYKQEVWQMRLENAGELAAAGVEICLTADTASFTYFLPHHVAVMVAHGLAEDKALEAITINPARLLAVDDRVGSLEPGKDADIAVFTGNPLSGCSRCSMTIIDGVIYHEEPCDSVLEIDYKAFQG